MPCLWDRNRSRTFTLVTLASMPLSWLCSVLCALLGMHNSRSSKLLPGFGFGSLDGLHLLHYVWLMGASRWPMRQKVPPRGGGGQVS